MSVEESIDHIPDWDLDNRSFRGSLSVIHEETAAKSRKIHCKMFWRVAELAVNRFNFCRFF